MKKYLLPSALILAFGLTLAVAQNITKSVQLSQSAGGPIGFDTLLNTYFPAHILSYGKSPTISAGTVAGTDFAGTITGSSTSVGGVLTFQQAYLAAPHCVMTPRTTVSASPLTYTTGTTNITYSHTTIVSPVFDYICSGAS